VGRCLRCDTIHADVAPTCPLCGGPVAATSLAQVTPLLARRTGARLEFVAGEEGEQLRRVGGIGGFLRYRIS
jgi:peptide subunit release factor 1 (eRF1)